MNRALKQGIILSLQLKKNAYVEHINRAMRYDW